MLPVRKRTTQSAYCTTIGRSRPYRLRSSRSSSSVTTSPCASRSATIASTASPGGSWITTKIAALIATTVTTMYSRRRTR